MYIYLLFFSFLSSGMLRGSHKAGNSVAASNSQTETIETMRYVRQIDNVV